MALALTLATPSFATPVGTIEGSLTNLPYGGWGGPLNITSSSTPAIDSILYAFCIDGLVGETYPSDQPHTFNVFDTASEVDTLRTSDPAKAAKVTGLMNYVVDNYFADFLDGKYSKLSPSGHRYDGYLFNEILWELTQDYAISGRGINVDPNSSSRGVFYYFLGDGDQNNLLTTVIADLTANFDSISESYRSSKYNVWFLDVAQSTYDPSVTNYQSLLAVSAKSNEVPEPSTLALLLAGAGVGLGLQRKRKTSV